MSVPTIEVYSDIHCPWAYLAVYRLRRLWPEYAGRLQVVWRALSLEYVNQRGTPKPILDSETALMRRIEPELPIERWPRPDWQWPVTFWPAFEALACAQAQGHEEAFAMSWGLRHAFFAEGQSPVIRSDLFAIARTVAAASPLDLARFQDDWDHGRYKMSVLDDSRRGWEELKAGASPTFVLPDGYQVSNPAAGHADMDGQTGVIHSYTPYEGDPLAVYRALLDRAIAAG